MNIMWMTWQPGILGNWKSAAGGDLWNQEAIKRLIAEGHNVWYPYAPVTHQPLGCTYIPTTKLDLAFVSGWRWHLGDNPKYKERNDLYWKQLNILSDCMGFNVPIVVHDEDHKMDEQDENWLRQNGAHLTQPACVPPSGWDQLIHPTPYKPHQPINLDRRCRIAYIGNNYERYDQTLRFFQPMLELYQKSVILYGNWLAPSPTRTSPERVKQDLPGAIFKDRISKLDVCERTSRSLATINLCKPSYAEVGLVVNRWWEAAVSGTPMFFPAEFQFGPFWSFFRDSPMVVNNGYEMASVFEDLMFDSKLWLHEINRLREAVGYMMNWGKFIIYLRNRARDHTKGPIVNMDPSYQIKKGVKND